MQNNRQNAAFYAFNLAQGGYIVISADDCARDVLCYSTEESFDANNLNPSLAWWLDRYVQQISALDDASDYTLESSTVSVEPISPLLGNIVWNQATPYNLCCPIDQWRGQHSLTGCVATGTAQIMRYWKYPTHGVGKHSYDWYDCKDIACSEYNYSKINIQFDTVPFDWKNMLESYTTYSSEQALAVARLMYAVGVACNMQYDSLPVGSAAWTDDMALGITSYFDYTYDSLISQYKDAAAYTKDKGSAPVVEIKYNIQDFVPAFNASLEANCPILMGGAGIGGGHEFVCDGRDANGLFHINWGWGGNGNNYCSLDALKPGGTTYWFYSGLDALVGLKPLHQPSAVERTNCPENLPQKLLINGQFYILRKGSYFTLQGVKKCQM